VPSKVLKIVAGMLTVCDTSYHGMRQAPASKFKVERLLVRSDIQVLCAVYIEY